MQMALTKSSRVCWVRTDAHRAESWNSSYPPGHKKGTLFIRRGTPDFLSIPGLL